jgi:hypothetical protein
MPGNVRLEVLWSEDDRVPGHGDGGTYFAVGVADRCGNLHVARRPNILDQHIVSLTPFFPIFFVPLAIVMSDDPLPHLV